MPDLRAALAFVASSTAEIAPPLNCADIGIALRAAPFQAAALANAENFEDSLRTIIVEFWPVLVTTAGDVSASTNINLLARVGEGIRH